MGCYSGNSENNYSCKTTRGGELFRKSGTIRLTKINSYCKNKGVFVPGNLVPLSTAMHEALLLELKLDSIDANIGPVECEIIVVTPSHHKGC